MTKNKKVNFEKKVSREFRTALKIETNPFTWPDVIINEEKIKLVEWSKSQN